MIRGDSAGWMCFPSVSCCFVTLLHDFSWTRTLKMDYLLISTDNFHLEPFTVILFLRASVRSVVLLFESIQQHNATFQDSDLMKTVRNSVSSTQMY